MKPFAQLPFADVPDRPRLPHRFFEAKVERIAVPSRPFGRTTACVRTFGEGPPLVLVHGFMTSGYSFRYVLDRLGRRFSLVIPDLVGAGESDKPDAPYGPDAVATWLGELLDALGLAGVPMIGNSLGGYLAMRLAMSRPRLLSRLVNLHSPGLPTARMQALGLAVKLVPGWRRALLAVVERDPERWVHKNVHYHDETLKSREEHAQYAGPLRTEEGRAAFARMLAETLSVSEMASFEKALRAQRVFPVPLLLVYAERDPMVPPEVGARLRALLPGAGWVQLREASHFAHVDAADRFLDAVEPFLAAGP